MTKTKQLLMIGLLSPISLVAQNIGNATQALNQATSELKQVYTVGVNMAMVIAGIVAVIALVTALVKWTQGQSEAAATAGKFLGGIIFFIIGLAIIKSAFSL